MRYPLTPLPLPHRKLRIPAEGTNTSTRTGTPTTCYPPILPPSVLLPPHRGKRCHGPVLQRRQHHAGDVISHDKLGVPQRLPLVAYRTLLGLVFGAQGAAYDDAA